MLEDVDFGRRMATHRELSQHPEMRNFNAIFDETGNFLIYATLVGIKVINLLTNKVERILGTIAQSVNHEKSMMQEELKTQRGSSM